MGEKRFVLDYPTQRKTKKCGPELLFIGARIREDNFGWPLRNDLEHNAAAAVVATFQVSTKDRGAIKIPARV